MQEPNSIPPPAVASLRTASRVLRRRWGWLAASAVLVCGLSVALSALQRARYSATSSVYLSQDNLADALSGISSSVAYDTPTLQRAAATQQAIAETTNVAALALKAVPEAHLSTRTFLADSSVAPNPNADILVFTASSSGRALAIKLANAYAASYIKYRASLDTASIDAARRQIEQRTTALASSGQEKSALYSSLVAKAVQLQSLATLETANADVIQQATTATQVAPRLERNAVIGLLLGVALGIAAMVLRQSFDNTIRPEDDLEELLGMPLVGRLPVLPRQQTRRGVRAPMLQTSGDSMAPYQLVRSSLDLSLLHAKMIMVTSADQGEGKSTTLANMAVSWARVGKAVLVIDADIRTPTQAALLGCNLNPGLTDVVRGTATLDDAIQAVKLRDEDLGSDLNGKLDVLSAGPPPINVSEFLALPDVTKVFRSVHEESGYDIVLVDTPPALMFEDAALMSRISDAVLLIARVGVLTTSDARELRRLVSQWDVRKLGVVQNGLSQRRPGYAYYRAQPAESRSHTLTS